jgi:hypothetical protein
VNIIDTRMILRDSDTGCWRIPYVPQGRGIGRKGLNTVVAQCSEVTAHVCLPTFSPSRVESGHG